MEIIDKYISDLDGLLREIKESSDLKEVEAYAFGHDMLIFLFGRIFRYLNFDSIFIKHERAGDFDATIWMDNQELILEFEVRSSHFNHDPEKCDLIVCWEDDWEKCPPNIDVFELKYLWDKSKVNSQ